MRGEALAKEFDRYFTYHCDECHDPDTAASLTFRCYEEFRDHCEEQHGELKLKATCCGKTFLYRTIMIDHLLFHVQPETLVCPHCQLPFTRFQKLKAHIEKAHTASDFKCGACDM